MIVNREFVRRFYHGTSPLGKFVVLGWGRDKSEWGADTLAGGEIVGIVPDLLEETPGAEPEPYAYVPFVQSPINDIFVMARSSLPLATALAEMRTAVRTVDADLPVYGQTSLVDALAQSVSQPRFYVLLLSGFAAVALLLAALGIYGVISYGVSTRIREFGIRIALGATRTRVMTLTIRQGVGLALIGIPIGLVAAYWLTRFVTALLFNPGAADAIAFVVAALVLLGTAALASYVPARRAASDGSGDRDARGVKHRRKTPIESRRAPRYGALMRRLLTLTALCATLAGALRAQDRPEGPARPRAGTAVPGPRVALRDLGRAGGEPHPRRHAAVVPRRPPVRPRLQRQALHDRGGAALPRTGLPVPHRAVRRRAGAGQHAVRRPGALRHGRPDLRARHRGSRAVRRQRGARGDQARARRPGGRRVVPRRGAGGTGMGAREPRPVVRRAALRARRRREPGRDHGGAGRNPRRSGGGHDGSAQRLLHRLEHRGHGPVAQPHPDQPAARLHRPGHRPERLDLALTAGVEDLGGRAGARAVRRGAAPVAPRGTRRHGVRLDAQRDRRRSRAAAASCWRGPGAGATRRSRGRSRCGAPRASATWWR